MIKCMLGLSFVFDVSGTSFAFNFCHAMMRWSVTIFILEFNPGFNR